MKKILSASVCAIAMAVAVPAFAADDAKPMHKHHMMKGSHMKGSHMVGPHTKMKPKGDPSTEDLNAKSLDAARGGSTPDAAPAGAMNGSSAAPAGSMSGPSAAPMTPPSSGMTGTTTPSNTPGGQ